MDGTQPLFLTLRLHDRQLQDMKNLPDVSDNSEPSVRKPTRSVLTEKQVVMISIGGVIGSSLFVGSGQAIRAAGPAILLSYGLAALIVVLVMQMLGEMAAAHPDSGSFSAYADRALGHWAGFAIGWLYVWFYILVVCVEALVLGGVAHDLLGVTAWPVALTLTFLLAVVNCISVQSFGKVEYWLSIAKITTILAFIGVGSCSVLGIFGFLPAVHFSNLYQHGGFMPNGPKAVVFGVLTAMFALQGSEVVTIAAAESDSPAENIRRATKGVLWRLGIFYFASLFIVICLVPWNNPALGSGSFQAALESMHIPYSHLIIEIVVFVAVLSCLNSGIYTASRMLSSLSRRGDAPHACSKMNNNGVPAYAVGIVLASAIFIQLIDDFISDGAYGAILASSGAIVIFIYIVIALSQIRLRPLLTKEGAVLRVKMWLHPWLSYATVLVMIGVLLVCLAMPDHRTDVLLTGALAVSLACLGRFVQARGQAKSGSLNLRQPDHQGIARK